MKIIDNKAIFTFGDNMTRVNKGVLLFDKEQKPRINEWFYSMELRREQFSTIPITREGCYPIVASSFHLKGVPLLMLDDEEMEKFCDNYFDTKMKNSEGFDLKPGWRKLVKEVHADTVRNFVEKDLIELLSRIASDVRKNGFGSHSVSHAYASHWMRENSKYIQSFLTPTELKLDVEEIKGDAGVIAHTFGESEFKLKTNDNNLIVY